MPKYRIRMVYSRTFIADVEAEESAAARWKALRECDADRFEEGDLKITSCKEIPSDDDTIN
jgi:hypothetical protein